MDIMHTHDETLVQKWGPVLEGINDSYTQRVTAQLLENQAKAIVSQNETLEEAAVGTGTTTAGQLGTFQKFAFPLVRRVYPELIANRIVGVQPMSGPVSQVFYLGNDRAYGDTVQTMYSKFYLTPRGKFAQPIGSLSAGTGTDGTYVDSNGVADTGTGLDGDAASFDVSNVLDIQGGQLFGAGAPSGTMGGQLAAWPNSNFTYGWNLSAGEKLEGTGIPEITFHIEQEAVEAKTRKMRALWTLEASQDLKAYHNLDLESELTTLLSKELTLEIDREIIEDLRQIAYGFGTAAKPGIGGSNIGQMATDYINLTHGQGLNVTGGTEAFAPGNYTYDQDNAIPSNAVVAGNVFIVDFTATSLGLQPRHVGEVYSNLLAVINLASQDIYRTTLRGPGSWILTSPLVASLLESAAKLEGGIQPADGPTNMGNSVEFRGKFMGRYDLFVDPMYPQDELMIGYKGSNAMDAGFIYAPYIPLQQLPTVTDPESFQPRKGILTRYGKVEIEPKNQFYRIIRIVGPSANYLYTPFLRNATLTGTSVGY